MTWTWLHHLINSWYYFVEVFKHVIYCPPLLYGRRSSRTLSNCNITSIGRETGKEVHQSWCGRCSSSRSYLTVHSSPSFNFYRLFDVMFLRSDHQLSSQREGVQCPVTLPLMAQSIFDSKIKECNVSFGRESECCPRMWQHEREDLFGSKTFRHPICDETHSSLETW